MRIKPFIILLALAIFISGCHYPPYAVAPATQTPAEVPSPSPQPTESLPPTVTPAEPEPPPLEPTPVPTIETVFVLQDGGPFYLPNFTHPDEGCQWMGVAGQVFDADGAEVLKLIVTAGMDHDENGLSDAEAITGGSTAYGLGGYEIQLASQPVDSAGVFWVQVRDQQGQQLSEQIYFDTYADCEQNLILVNFVPLDD